MGGRSENARGGGDLTESQGRKSRWEIRPFQEDDFDAVHRLWSSTEGLGIGPGDTREAVARYLRRNPGLSLVAVDVGTPVAAVLCGHDGRRGYIYRLAVADAYRRRGLAAELVTRCLANLRTEGIERCQAFVLVDNSDARAFWEAMGGKPRSDLLMHSLPV